MASAIHCMIHCKVYAHANAGNMDDILDYVHREMHHDCADHGLGFYQKKHRVPKKVPACFPKCSKCSQLYFPIFGEPVLRDIGTKRISLPLTRFYLPLKPVLNTASVGSLDDNEYCHMSTRYKASHIKLMMWWVAKRTTEAASQFTAEPCPGLVTTNYPHVHVFRIPLMSIFVFFVYLVILLMKEIQHHMGCIKPSKIM